MGVTCALVPCWHCAQSRTQALTRPWTPRPCWPISETEGKPVGTQEEGLGYLLQS